MNIDRQAGWCVHYWHCVFIRCVGGYSLYVILKLLGWDGVSVLRTGRERAGGGGEVEFLTEKKISAKKCSWGLKTPKKYFFFFFKNVPGVLKRVQTKIYFSGGGGGGDFGVFGAPHAPTRGSRGVGKQYTSSYDHDMWPVKILERSGLAVKSYHPETLAAEE